MRNQMLVLALGFSTMLLGACAHQTTNDTAAPAASANPPMTAESPKPDSHMAMQQDTMASMSPHDRIARCNAEATDKHLKVDAIQSFLNSCLSQQNSA